MDTPTREIVASNLAAAYCANHKEPLSEADIIEIYRGFVKLLEEPPGEFKFTPGLPWQRLTQG